MFEALLTNIEYDTAHKIFYANVQRTVQPAQPRNLTTNQPVEATASPQRRKQKKVGRNDPCPCGSGKKYKLCHGAPAGVGARS